MFSFYVYPILIFHACIPIGILLHPVDVGLAARHPYGMVARAAEVVGAVVVDDAVFIREVDGLRAFAVCRNRDGVDIAGFEGCQGADRNYGRFV